MNTVIPRKEQEEELWEKAQAAGMSRRKFLILLAGSGAAAVLTACTSSPIPTPAPAPSPAPAPATRAIHRNIARF